MTYDYDNRYKLVKILVIIIYIYVNILHDDTQLERERVGQKESQKYKG